MTRLLFAASAAALLVAACNDQGDSDAVNAAQDAASVPVGQASADMFDGVYLDQQIAAHNEAVALHRGFQDNTDAPTLAAHAREVLPKIEAHLARAQELDSAT